jgi:hypothetical protein
VGLLKLATAALIALSPISPMAGVPEGSCEVESAEITWGFKESFRSYISGSLANGEWLVTGDVGYATPSFTFTGGEGHILADRSGGEVAFVGDMRFVGHGGILDTTVSSPRLVLDGPRQATLFFDVAGDTMEEVAVSEGDVPFVTVEWRSSESNVDAVSGTWKVVTARTTLSVEGSDAFGTYPAGEEMDPLTFALTVAPGCADADIPGGVLLFGAAGVAVIGAGAALVIYRVRRSRGPGRQ